MKILSYNIFHGAEHTFNELVVLVHTLQPDIVCLQEANGWSDNADAKATEFAKLTGLTNVAMGKSDTPFEVITFSKRPMMGATSLVLGNHHPAVRCSVSLKDDVYDFSDAVELWNVHLNPYDEMSRVHEVEILPLSYGKRLVVGDFNSLSYKDLYDVNLLTRLQQRGITKFGSSELQYDVINHMEHHGWVDIGYGLNMDWTVPTLGNRDPAHAEELRLDYMFCTHDLVNQVTGFDVVKNELTDMISDHYPILMTLE